MKYLQLTWFHFKGLVMNNWGLAIFTIVMPLVTIAGLFFVEQSSTSALVNINVGVVNHSDEFEASILPQLDEAYQDLFIENPDEAFEKLNQAELAILYEIPADFMENGAKIQTYSLNGTNYDPFFEAELTQIIQQNRTETAFAEANLAFEIIEIAEPVVEASYVSMDTRLMTTIFMTIFFMNYSVGIIGSNLAKKRQEGLLRRSIVSNTYSWEILGSILSAYTVYNIISCLIVIGAISLMFSVPLTNIPMILSIIFAFCVFSVGLTMVLFRLLKNDQAILMLGIFLTIILIFIPLFGESISIFSQLQYISPYYWLFDTLDTGVVFPNMFIVVLYGLVLFTAGSFKIEKLAKAY